MSFDCFGPYLVRELQVAFEALEPQPKPQFAEYQILFKFNLPGDPHFGGVWEREVRSIKNALQVAVGSQVVSEDILYTVLVKVEGILNSKPIGYASADVADPDPITPNILLMRRRTWRHSKNLADQFWVHFTRNDLPTLQTQQKWQKSSGNMSVDSIVLIVDPQFPRAQWPMVRVTKTVMSRRMYPISRGPRQG